MHMRKVAHRGHARKFPENSKAAFRAALELTCDAIELDIHLNAAGELIIYHDYDFEAQHKLYTLKEYLVDIAPYTESLIEIKAHPEHRTHVEIKQTCDALDDLLTKHNHLNFRLLCFQHEWLKYLKEKNSAYNCVKNFYETETINENEASCLDAFSFNIKEYQTSALELGRKLNKQLMFWTCNTKKQIAEAVAQKADYIMSDDIRLISC